MKCKTCAMVTERRSMRSRQEGAVAAPLFCEFGRSESFFKVPRSGIMSHSYSSDAGSHKISFAIAPRYQAIDPQLHEVRDVIRSNLEQVPFIQDSMTGKDSVPMIIEELIANALVATESSVPHRVRLGLQTQNLYVVFSLLICKDYVELSLRDSGCGLPPEKIAEALSPKKQKNPLDTYMDTSLGMRHSGNGLRLAFQTPQTITPKNMFEKFSYVVSYFIFDHATRREYLSSVYDSENTVGTLLLLHIPL